MKNIRDTRYKYTATVQPRAMDHFDFNQILDTGTKAAKAVGTFSSLFGKRGGSTQVDNTAVQNFLTQQAAQDRAQNQPTNSLAQSWLKMDRMAIAAVAVVVIIAAVGAFLLFKK